MLAAYIFLFLIGLTLVLAVVRGDNEDRIAAVCFLAAALLSMFADELSGQSIAKPEIGVVLTDLVLLGALICFVLRSRRFWPLWATGFHLAAVFTHLAVWMDAQTVPAAYALSLGLWSFPTLGALTVSLIFRDSLVRAGSSAYR